MGILYFVSLFVIPVVAARADEPLRYNRDIRPILSENCFSCHGPDAGHRKAGLRLDVQENATTPAKSGDIAIVPGNISKSALAARIDSSDDEEMMPRPESNKKLTSKQKEMLKRWISEGASYEPHWAFIPPTSGKIPATHSLSWCFGDLDHFVLANLEKQGLKPAPEADKATLIRRASLDLTGLPPTIQEVDAFLADSSALAYESVVDRLLQSPHFGERMAVDWMDAARYADSNGYQIDRDRETHAWRDWVIGAFNRNMPFDQFTIEQLAGDLLPDPTLEQRIATGFNRNHLLNEEGGIIREEFLNEGVADRAETTATVWLGQTFNCTRCHDHKFDPFTQRDYYSLFAFFNNVSEKGIGNDDIDIRHNAPPFVSLPAPASEAKLHALNQDLNAANFSLTELEKEPPSHSEEWLSRLQAAPTTWNSAEISSAQSNKKTPLVTVADNALQIGTSIGEEHTITVRARVSGQRITAVQIELCSADAGTRVQWADLAVYIFGTDGNRHRIALTAATADRSINAKDLANVVDDNRLTFSPVVIDPAQSVEAVFELESPIPPADSTPATVEFVFGVQIVKAPVTCRIATSTTALDLLAPSSLRMIAEKPAESRTPVEIAAVTAFRVGRLPAHRLLTEQISSLKKRISTLESELPTALVMDEMALPRPTHILRRGAYDDPGERVSANTPAALFPMAEGQPRNRLGLARWIMDPRNPLTSRVTVNRLWQSVFGVGLVKTSEDFGAQGEPPSHPELLDWLANAFVRSGWNVKFIMKLLVTSATYRQSSKNTSTLRERDPENRWLGRTSRIRLPAEFIRDQALAASGLLIPTIGGPSVRPYHPPGLYEQVLAGRDSKTYLQGRGDDLYRRSLYTFWKRSVPNPGMLIFDASFREACTVRRSRTNTPLQALNLMNDPTYIEASRFIAQRMLSESGPTPDARVTHGFRLLLARHPNAFEKRVLLTAYERWVRKLAADTESTRNFFQLGERPNDPKFDSIDLAACAAVASTILSMDATITRE